MAGAFPPPLVQRKQAAPMPSPGKTCCMLLALLALTTTSYAGTATIGVSATILSKNNCKFATNAANLLFGELDPLAAPAPDVTRQATIDFTCNGKDNLATYSISDDDGQHESGLNGNRMQNSANPAAYLPYAFSVAAASGTINKGETATLTVTGTVLADDYRMAHAGSYSDAVVITVNP